MKNILSYSLVLFLGLTLRAGQAPQAQPEDVSSMVQDEIRKTQREVKQNWDLAKAKLNDLRAQRERVILDSKRQGEDEVKGQDLMQKYTLLLVSRYRNDKNEFESGMEIPVKEQENINRLFHTYLHSSPLRGHTSAGEAKRVLELGAKNLAASSKLHLEPTQENNSELEIVQYQIKNAEVMLHKASELVKVLGINPEERMPASVPNK